MSLMLVHHREISSSQFVILRQQFRRKIWAYQKEILPFGYAQERQRTAASRDKVVCRSNFCAGDPVSATQNDTSYPNSQTADPTKIAPKLKRTRLIVVG